MVFADLEHGFVESGDERDVVVVLLKDALQFVEVLHLLRWIDFPALRLQLSTRFCLEFTLMAPQEVTSP